MKTIEDTYIIDDIDNLLLNMNAGLLPKNLTKDEVELLENRYGKNWFNELGFTEPKYERSCYDHYNTSIN